MIQMYLQMAVSLIAVVGLIYLISNFMKKRQGRPGLFKMLSYQPLGPKKGVAALKLGREVLLFSITATDLKLLRIYDEHKLGLDSLTAPEASGDVSGKKSMSHMENI
ncbi:MAG: flagellar biosynthetic protein FliO [Nitrospiraceae bacterium]|nr:flagellar biosynthetic protein FliO [Nitrospiraceae bacterium]